MSNDLSVISLYHCQGQLLTRPLYNPFDRHVPHTMYGRNNIFANNTNNNSNNNYYPNSHNSTNNSSSQYRPNNHHALGSYRLQYRYEQPPSYLSSHITQWKQQPPSSIVTREQTLHLTTTQLRIQDYFIMRRKQLKPSHQSRLRDAIRGDCFNEELLKFEFQRLPPVSDQRPLDLDAVRNMRSNQGSSQYSNYRNDERGNIFNSSSSNNVSNNIFSQNSSNRSGNNNPFNSENRGSSVFNNNSNYNTRSNTSNNNIFANNSSGNYNNNCNNSSNNNYNNSSNNNSSSYNIFSRNNSNSNSNMFNSNNQNNSNNNLFGNRTTGNNLFNNNNNNNNNNLFNNSRTGNNLFNNNNNNNPGLPPEILLNLQYTLEQNVKIMQALQQKINPTDQAQQQTKNEVSPLDELASRSEPVDFNYFLNPSRINPPRQQKIIIVKPPWLEEYQNMRSSQLINQSRISGSQLMGNYPNILKSNQPSILRSNHSRIIPNEQHLKRSQIMATQSRILPNHRIQDGYNLSKSIANRSLANASVKMPNTFQDWQGCCMCEFQLQVEWQDDLRKQMDDHKLRLTVQLDNLKLSDQGWRSQTVKRLKQLNPMVRVDAELLVTECNVKDSSNSAQFLVRGRLGQKITNLADNYSVCYSQIKNCLLYNLTISNQFGSMAWEKPIPARELDFVYTKDLVPFLIGQNEVVCEIPALNCKCVVNFVGLPKYIQQVFSAGDCPKNREIKQEFMSQVSKRSNGAFKLLQMWKNEFGSGWTMAVEYFPKQQASEE